MNTYACRSTVSGIWVSRRTGQCPGSRLISQIVAMQRFLPRHPVGSGGHHLRWPLAQHGGERHWVPASESPVPEGVRQGPRRDVSPFSRSYKTTNNTPRPRSVHSGEGAYRTTHTHTRARSGPTVHARSTGRSPHVSPSSQRSRQRRDITTPSCPKTHSLINLQELAGEWHARLRSTYLAYFEVLMSQIFNRRYDHRMRRGK